MPHPDSPESYPRRILLAVTGLSPQILTETLYALVQMREPAWVPTEIQLITTRRGAENARLNLLSEEPGWFHRLRSDYRLPPIAFGPGDIHVMRGRDGSELEDIRDDADNTAAADFITEHVRALTADPQSSLHVSIAGGRKTMGFFLGYALSLFGRTQDRLSHVLVSSPFESHNGFYYPSPRTRVLHANQDALDAKDGKVWLGDIPFVRLRDGLPQDLLKGGARFSEAVGKAQEALPPRSLVLDPQTCEVIAGGEKITLKPAEFSFYWMLAERCRQHRPGVHWSEPGLGQELLSFYRQLRNPNSGDVERAEQSYRRFSKENFDPRKTHIKNALVKALGTRRAAPYLIAELDCIPGTRYRRSGLTLPPEVIRIGGAAQNGGAASLRGRPRRDHVR